MVFFLQPVYGVDCAPSASGATFTVNGSCSFVGGTTAGTAVGVDYGTEANTAVLKTTSGTTLTVSANQTLATGSLDLTSGGSFVLISGSQIKIGTPLYITDTDADGYPSPSDTALYYGWVTGRVRRSSLVSMTLDCNDASASVFRSVAGYLDSDADGYGAGAYTTCVGATGSYVASGTDCYDGNASAYPGSGACSGGNRGDGSYDWNCDGGASTCGTTYYSYKLHS